MYTLRYSNSCFPSVSGPCVFILRATGGDHTVRWRIVFSRNTLLKIFLVGFICVHVLTGILDLRCCWGMHQLLFLPRWVLALFLLLSSTILVVVFRPSVGFSTDRFVVAWDFWGPNPHRYLRRTALLLLLAVAFIEFRSAVHLLGDGYLYLRELPLGFETKVWRVGHEPASLRLVGLLYENGRTWNLSPELAYRFFSYLSGFIYLLLTFPVAQTIGTTLRERLLVLGFLLTPGYMQFFFGYVETYAILMPAVLLYLLVCIRALRGEGHFWMAPVVLGLTIPLHFTITTLVPSLLVLAMYQSKDQSLSRKTASLLTSVVGTGAIAVAILLIQGIDPFGYLTGLRVNHFLPLWSEPDPFQPYRLFSWGHLCDIINLLLLVAPAAILALPLALGWPKRNSSIQVFLMSTFAFPLLLVWLVNPEIGTFRDWDVLALPALPLTLWAAAAMVNSRDGRVPITRIGLIVCSAAALHTSLWIGLNSHAAAAETRFVHNLQGCELSQHARAYGWETLGLYYDQKKHDNQATLDAFQMALAADEANPRYWNLAGVAYAKLGRYEEAISHLEQAVGRQRDTNPKHLNNLASVYSEVGRQEAAVRCLEEAVTLQPGYAEGHHNLGLALAKAGRLESAVEALRRASELEPNNAEFLKDLGSALIDLDRHMEAIACLTKVTTANPEDVEAIVQLGRAFLKSGQMEKAVSLWEDASVRMPEVAEFHFHLGFAYAMAGRIEQAKFHLAETLTLAPDHPQATAIRQMQKSLEP